MKALTILQPWAALIAVGAKQVETRSWATKHRGPMLIHAGLSFHRQAFDDLDQYLHIGPVKYVGGAVIAVAELVDCIKMTPEYIASVSDQERAVGFFEPGRYAWVLANVQQIPPILKTGKLGLWEWEEAGLQ